MLLWDPLGQLTSVFPEPQTCVVNDCFGHLQFTSWRMGQSEGKWPRIIHDVDNVILLVSATYKCDSGHEVIGSDARITQMIPSQYLPFVLLHRTGYTKRFITTVVTLVQDGLTIHAVERFITEQREEFVSQILLRLKHQIELANGVTLSSEELSHICKCRSLQLLYQPVPSNDAVSKCFICDYEDKQSLYTNSMLALKIKECISFDHTFKVAANIGYLRPDGKWVTQYSSVFLVLNELGQVVTWQFTKRTSLDEVATALSHLCDRIEVPEGKPLLALTDKCCSDRKKIKQIFGDSTEVKLDLFHGVQRITKKMSKRHPSFYSCKDDLKLVFRHPTDLGRKRTLPTPKPDQLQKNMDRFTQKWSARTSIHGTQIINEKVLKELNALKQHMQRGCLSDIAVSRGTNRNENLHRNINPHFSRNRIGIPLALALLSALLYKHNKNIEEKLLGGPQLEHRILNRIPTTDINAVSFGVVQKEVGTNSEWISLPSVQKYHFCSTSLSESHFSVIFDDTVSEFLTVHDGIKILTKAMQSTELAHFMSKQSNKSPLFNYHMIPFMSSVASLFFHRQECLPENRCAQDDNDKVSNLLKAWGMELHQICGDGNCCFSATAFALITEQEQIESHCPNYFSSHGLTFSHDLSNLAQQLRNVAVKEWKQNCSFYEEFIVDVNVQEEAEKFLLSGYFYGSLGDSMVVALSNALELPFIVFSSLLHHPIINITPRRQCMPVPVFLAYVHHAAGHYDAVVLKDVSVLPHNDIPTDVDDVEQIHCTCGKRDKGDSPKHCIQTTSTYGTLMIKCPCLKKKQPCSHKCRCKNCENPCGQSTSGPPAKRQKRFAHSWQREHLKSSLFASAAKENVSLGPATMLEFFVLENIIEHCSSQADITTEIVHILYDAVASIAATLSEQHLPLGPKSLKEIKSFMETHDKNLTLFQEQCLAQLDSE